MSKQFSKSKAEILLENTLQRVLNQVKVLKQKETEQLLRETIEKEDFFDKKVQCENLNLSENLPTSKILEKSDTVSD